VINITYVNAFSPSLCRLYLRALHLLKQHRTSFSSTPIEARNPHSTPRNTVTSVDEMPDDTFSLFTDLYPPDPTALTLFEIIGLRDDAFDDHQAGCSLPDLEPTAVADNSSPRESEDAPSDRRHSVSDSKTKKPKRYGCPGNNWLCKPEELRARRAWTSFKKFSTHLMIHREEFVMSGGLKCLSCEGSPSSPESNLVNIIFPSGGQELAKHIWERHMTVQTRMLGH
jgi:hypothetical protein